MPFQALRSYVCARLSANEAGAVYDFENSFAGVVHATTTHEEAVILLLALVPHVLPGFFDGIIAELRPGGGDWPELGGVRTGNHRGLQATGETAQYILAGDEMQHRINIQAYFSKEHWFCTQDILQLEMVAAAEPKMSGRLQLTENGVALLLYGQPHAPEHSISFPARKITTSLGWDDLVLPPGTRTQLDDIVLWQQHQQQILQQWGQHKYFKEGFRCLFYGPSGTGKTLTASLIGKEIGRVTQQPMDVYRVDLSMIVSRYIGETEKNLEQLFQQAEHKNWILFFDEGEHFFSSRTGIRDAHDKYANQEVSYLLQRIEDYKGIIIVATNLKTNIDPAFARRFQAMISFAKPGKDERRMLWEHMLPAQDLVARSECLVEALLAYELTGGNIVNVVQYACLRASEKAHCEIALEDCMEGIRRELAKEGRTI